MSRSIHTILGQIRGRAEMIAHRGTDIRHDPELRALQILSSADDAEAILAFVEEASAEILKLQLTASIPPSNPTR